MPANNLDPWMTRLWGGGGGEELMPADNLVPWMTR